VQLDQLWTYTQTDMEAERFEGEMRKAPNRVRLLQLRNFILEQQNNMKKVEAEVASMAERLEAARAEYEKLQASMRELTGELADAQEDSVAELEGLIEEAQRLTEALSKCEQDVQKMRRDADLRDRQQKEIRTKAAKSKQEYDQLKVVYDSEFKRDSETLKTLKAKVDAAGKAVDPALLERYKAIRQHCVPPMAKLVNGQCSGCNMALASAVLRRISAGDEIVECDNCGRILYATEEA